jgi:peptide/nickel transport system permease protein
MTRLKSILSFALPVMILLFLAFGFLAEPNSPAKTNIRAKYAESSAEYPLGTDNLGRCELSRLLEGGKTTLGIVLAGSGIVLVLGIALGLLFTRTGGKSNVLSDSILNAVTAVPPVAYLIILIGIWGNSIPTMIVALTVSLILRMVKLVMTLAEVEYGKAYVKCAVACGAGKPRILIVHILPVILRDIVQFVCLSCSDMILAISGFSFIGLTLGSDVIDWGGMLSDARSVYSLRPALLYDPILLIFISSLCFNFLGSRLHRRDA